MELHVWAIYLAVLRGYNCRQEFEWPNTWDVIVYDGSGGWVESLNEENMNRFVIGGSICYK